MDVRHLQPLDTPLLSDPLKYFGEPKCLEPHRAYRLDGLSRGAIEGPMLASPEVPAE